MSANKFTSRRRTKSGFPGILFFLTSAFLITGAFGITRITLSADGIILSSKSATQLIKFADTPEPRNTPPTNIPPQTAASRIKITIGETRSVSIAGASNSVIIVSPEIAAAEIKNEKELIITGLKIGETILIISGDGKRETYVVEVAGMPSIAERQNRISAENALSENSKTSGSVNVLYAQGFDQSPSLIRNRFEFRRKLSADRTLRASGEMYKFFGGNNRLGIGNYRNYGLDRISVGVDSPDKTIDFLDSQVRLSPIGFNSFEMRGFHLAETPKLSKNSDSPRRGLEIFAGFARPTYALYDNPRQKLVGAMIPVAGSDSWQIRAGFIAVTAPRDNQLGRGGTVLQVNGSYAPNEKLSADGELGYANGELSWGARLNLRFKQFGAFGEISKFDKDSPLAGINALSGGRRTESFSAYWRPGSRFNFSANYNHTDIGRFSTLGFANFNRSTLSVNAGYRPDKNSRFYFRFTDQQIETAELRGSSKFQIATRTFAAGHNIRFYQRFSNDFEARIILSREANAASGLETGFNLREQLRYSWSQSSLTGFFNYTNRTSSLTSLIIRNPQLLPLDLQPIFALNPTQFLQLYRDRLALLLPGIELPQTRSADLGVRFQTTVSRFTLSGETRYIAGEIYSQNQKNLYTSIGVDFRLDAANSIQINGWHSFGGTSGGSAIIFGYTHRFGSDSGNGFQFSKFLGFNKGKVRGRVYDDLNGNGQDDAGEPGISGLTIQLNEKRSVKTDIDGRYEFSANEGRYNVSLISEDLGVRLRASTATQKEILLPSGQTTIVSFGVSGFGFLTGRIFNDADLAGETSKSNFQGVKLILRSLEARSENSVVTQMSGKDGRYSFRNLSPGNYSLEIDALTLPANFRLPAQTSWKISVMPLQEVYLEIPVSAGRAITGIVFIDKDGNGKFNPETDETVEGASINVNDTVALSDKNGAYILRNLSAGKIKITIRSASGAINSPVFIELSSEPETKRAINFAIKR